MVLLSIQHPNNADGRRPPRATLVGLEKSLEHEAGEELMLRELLRAVARRIERQASLGGRQCRQQNRSRRFTGTRHAFNTNASDTTGHVASLG